MIYTISLTNLEIKKRHWNSAGIPFCKKTVSLGKEIRCDQDSASESANEALLGVPSLEPPEALIDPAGYIWEV